jgi:hypothetical protein
MANKNLVNFITEARKRGFTDRQIINPLLEKGWPMKEIKDAFLELYPKYKSKNQVCLFLGDEIIEIIEKRAKKNMFTVSEQIEDIIRRSCSTQLRKKSSSDDKIDDILLKCFSRSNRGRKKKS